MSDQRAYEALKRKLFTAIVTNAGRIGSDANLLRDLLQVDAGELNPQWTRVFDLCRELRDAISEAVK